MIDQRFNQEGRETSDKVCLAAMPATLKELREKTGLAEDTVRKVAARLHGEKCHISGWQWGVRKMHAVYAAGTGVDMPKPKVCAISAASNMRMRERQSIDLQSIALLRTERAIPLVEQALRQPNSIWAFAAQQAV